jgi:hypothetical protein
LLQPDCHFTSPFSRASRWMRGKILCSLNDETAHGYVA